MTDIYAMLDAGTSSFKASIGNEEGKITGFARKEWGYFTPPDLEPYGHEFNPDDFWKIIVETTREAIRRSGANPEDIKAVTVTSQRHGCVFLDVSGKELYAGPNRDARGLEIDTDDYMDADELYDITGHGPPFLFPLARYLWFQENDEETCMRIKHLLMIDGWLAYRLTGKYIIDDTAAAETLLYDIRKRDWSTKILDEFEIPVEILPERVRFAENLGELLPAVADQLGLSSRTMAVVNAADSQAALIGSGAFRAGDIGIVAGSTIPVMMVVNKPIVDEKCKIWTGAFSIPQHWVIESNAGPGGTVYDWFREAFLDYSGQVHNSHELFGKIVQSAPPGSSGVFADLGTQIMDSTKFTQLPSTRFVFPPASFGIGDKISLGSFARAAVENIAYAVLANIEQIEELSGIKRGKIFITGGLSRVKPINQILADMLGVPIYMTDPEATSLCGIAASLHAVKGVDYDEAVNKIVKPVITANPSEEAVKVYKGEYARWKEIYRESRSEQ